MDIVWFEKHVPYLSKHRSKIGEKFIMEKKKIAFIRPKNWPLTNQIVYDVLCDQFPNHDVVIFDVNSIILKNPGALLTNLFLTIFLYGLDILKRKKRLRLSFWRTPYIFHQIKRLLQKRITPQEYAFTFQIQSLFDCSISGVPHFVYTDHTHLENLKYSSTNPAKLYAPEWIALEKQIYHNASLVFVRSLNVQRSVIEDYQCPPKNVILVYAGSNVNISPIKTVNADYSTPHILFVGIEWKRKGGPDLIEAFKLVRETCPQARLTIVGAKPDIQLPNCDVIGPVKSADLDRYYQKASIFCLPTYVEPFGIVFIEAMSAHLPIIATRVGAIPDFVEDGDNGWLVEPGDVPGLANALLKLINNPQDCAVFGERGFQQTQQRYSWLAVGKRFREHIIQKINSNS